MFRKSVVLFVTAFLLIPSGLLAKVPHIDEVDKRAKSFKLSSDSKKEVIKELKQHILSFAHLERKAALYDLPQNLFFSIKDDFANLEDMAFFKSLMKEFAKQNDSHTRAYYPDYMSCRRASIPIRFRFFRDGDSDDSWGKVLVYSIKDSKVFSVVNVGDELLQVEDFKINQKNFEALRATNAQSKRGYYESIADSFLHRVDGRYNEMPKRDVVYLLFKDYKTKELYDIEVPWEYDYSGCRKVSLYKDLNISKKEDEPVDFDFRSNLYGFEKIKNPEGLTEDLIVAGIVKRKDIKNAPSYGYLRIHSFDTFEDKDKGETINEFIDKTMLSLAELMNIYAKKKIDGLIIDMRHNPGGWIELAHHMLRVFDRDNVRPVLMQFANGEMSLKHLRDEREEAEKERAKILKKKLWSAFPYTTKFFNWNSYEKEILAVRGTSLRLAKEEPHFVEPADSLNPLSPEDDFPKVVLGDRFCVSSCDMFISMFRENGVGKFIGETTRGAGGMVHEGRIELEGKYGKKKYKAKFPFRYAYTNILSPNGHIIEDIGVKPDYYFRDYAKEFQKGEGEGSWIEKSVHVLKAMERETTKKKK